MKTNTMNTTSNHFEVAFILVAGHLAFDSGVCTWHDDAKVDAEWSNPLIRQFSRYGDDREDDVLPTGLKFVNAREFSDMVADVTITIN